MSSNPHASRELSVTIKTPESERYKQDGPWFVFKGEPAAIREDIVTVFQLEEADDATLAEVVFAAQEIATAQRAVSGGGAGRSFKSGSGKSGTKAAEPETPAEEVDPLAAEIANLTDLESHKNCWADNKARLNDEPELLDAWKAKGAELKAAAAA